MKRVCILILSLCLSLQLFAEDKPKEIKSSIKSVTVFTKGAQVSREVKVAISKGTSILKFIDISPAIDRNSIQVKADGDFTILSVTNELNFFKAPKKDKEIEKIITEQQKLQDQFDDENTLFLVLQEEENLILSHKPIGGGQKGIVVEEIKAAAELYRTRLKDIRLEKLSITRKIRSIQNKKSLLAEQLKELNYQEQKNTTEVLVSISSKKATSGKFTVSYIVNNAGWTPHYDLRVKDVQSPVQLAYKANVYQTTGESWDKVLLTLSTGDPSQSGTKPILYPWMLNFNTYAYQQQQPTKYNSSIRQVSGVIRDEYGEALIGANVYIKGTNTGTATDINGRYTLNVPEYGQSLVVSYIGYNTIETTISTNTMNIVLNDSGIVLDEVMVTSLSGQANGVQIEKNRRRRRNKKDKAKTMAPTQPVPVQEIEKATTVSFKIDLPYDIPSNGKQYVVQVKEHELPAYYEYYCAPKLDLDAFLTAQVTGWEDFNLLNGEASLFFEGTYLGKSFLNVQSVEDTLDLSLGRDKNIVIKRTKQKENTKKKFLSNKRVDTRAWDIEVRNKKKQAINMVIEDQIPISVTEEIEVDKEYKDAELEEDTGILTWKFKLPSNTTKEMNFKYTVKYPKKKRVYLE